MADLQESDLKKRVAHILATEVEPAMQMPSGSIQVLDVTDGIVRLRLGDVCASCPSSVMVMVMELEQELRKRIPEIAYLEAAP
ncbi:MAG TPA: NifU family protein [Gemmataceae bacterium]|jgi:Fe-S cluster biogenesis protein NfuA|nr:NifU family protein [Gemmataceae bacterium]